jgi:hypothetical protein
MNPEHQNVANSMGNERFELKNAGNTVDMAASSSKMLQMAPKCCKFELKNAANTVEMAPSSSKMLQIARKMDRTGNQKNIPKRKKTTNNSGPLYDCIFCLE